MKTSIKAAVVGAVIGVVVTLLVLNLGETRAHAQVNVANEEYFCLPLPDTIKAGDFKSKLDALGKEGWKVRCSIGATLILAR
jgi:hypothetical protein